MKIAIMIKDKKLSAYPSDLLIGDKVVKSYNLLFELKSFGVDVVVGKSLSSELIKVLRDNGIVFLKVDSIDELDGLDFKINFAKEKLKRGVGCQSRFKL